MANILITGAAGFVGLHLLRHLKAQGDVIYGFDLPGTTIPLTLKPEIQLFHGNLCEDSDLLSALQAARPEIIFHLAGSIKSPHPEDLYRGNALGTLTMFESLLRLRQTPKVVITSSSAVYGPGLGRRPLTETFRPRPQTHYAISKVAQEEIALLYQRTQGIQTIITRAFNIIGPGQPASLALSAFAAQISLAECGQAQPVINTGNLSAYRDLVDVRDVVKAYAMLAQDGIPGQVYNVASGRAVTIQSSVDILLSMAKIPLQTRLDPQRIQPNDIPYQVGSLEKIQRQTGWQPTIPLRQSLADLLDDWRIKTNTSGGV